MHRCASGSSGCLDVQFLSLMALKEIFACGCHRIMLGLIKLLFSTMCRSHTYRGIANTAEPAGVQLLPSPGQRSRSGGDLRAEQSSSAAVLPGWWGPPKAAEAGRGPGPNLQVRQCSSGFHAVHLVLLTESAVNSHRRSQSMSAHA